jgi:hypothetical protein
MAYYLVRACVVGGIHTEIQQSPLQESPLRKLHDRLVAEELAVMRPFGPAITKALNGARWDETTGEAVWEEEDYCSPPLAMEREQVLDEYFDDIRVERVQQGEGWGKIDELPLLWDVLELS